MCSLLKTIKISNAFIVSSTNVNCIKNTQKNIEKPNQNSKLSLQKITTLTFSRLRSAISCFICDTVLIRSDGSD